EQALEDPDHRFLHGLVRVHRVGQEPPADVPREGAVAAMDLDERFGVPGLEVQHEQTVVDRRVIVAPVAYLRNPCGHTSPLNGERCEGVVGCPGWHASPCPPPRVARTPPPSEGDIGPRAWIPRAGGGARTQRDSLGTQPFGYGSRTSGRRGAWLKSNS